MALKGLQFALAGPQRSPDGVLSKIIRKNGGSFATDVTAACTHLLVTWDMAACIDNDYKLQWFPDFKPRVERAQMLGIPIVDEDFLHHCIEEHKIVDKAPFLVLGSESRSEAQITAASATVEKEKSQLDPRVASVIEMLFDKRAMDKTLKEMNLDFSKMHLVTEQSIKRAYQLLSQLEEVVQNMDSLDMGVKAKGQTKQNPVLDRWEKQAKDLSNQFYSTIPHNYGGHRPPVIRSEQILQEKLSMLESLADIEIASRLMAQTTSDSNAAAAGSLHPTDIKYRKLRTKIVPLEKSSKAYDIIEQYVSNTQAEPDVLSPSKFSLEMMDVFEVEREGEKDRFNALYAKLPNHLLLWHGSRTTNFVGILSKGLRIAPPEAPVTGYYLGKGLYFADMVSKSAEFCRASKSSPIGFLLLCDVALGRCFQVTYGKSLAKADLEEVGYHSTKCYGEYAPAPGFDVDIEPGLVVPLGKETRIPVFSSELRHNEYVVYDVEQVHIRYLVKVKFQFY